MLETRFLVYAGVVSYSVYLWHEPLIRWLAAHDLTFHGRWADAGNVVLVTALTLAIATVSYLLVERPAMSLRTRRRARGRRVGQRPGEVGTARRARLTPVRSSIVPRAG